MPSLLSDTNAVDGCISPPLDCVGAPGNVLAPSPLCVDAGSDRQVVQLGEHQRCSHKLRVGCSKPLDDARMIRICSVEQG